MIQLTITKYNFSSIHNIVIIFSLILNGGSFHPFQDCDEIPYFSCFKPGSPGWKMTSLHPYTLNNNYHHVCPWKHFKEITFRFLLPVVLHVRIEMRLNILPLLITQTSLSIAPVLSFGTKCSDVQVNNCTEEKVTFHYPKLRN